MTRRSLSTAYKIGSLVRRKAGQNGKEERGERWQNGGCKEIGHYLFTSQPAACIDNQRAVGVLFTDFPAVVGCEGVDAANVVLRLNTRSAVTKVVRSASNTGGGGKGRDWTYLQLVATKCTISPLFI